MVGSSTVPLTDRFPLARGGSGTGLEKGAASASAAAPGAFSFSLASTLPMLSFMDGSLPPELEQFAAEAVASGRFESRDDVIAAGLNLLRQEEAGLVAFAWTLDGAEAEGERLGFSTLEEVMRETDAQIEEMSRRRR